MKRYLTVDGGTTNTRIYLNADNNVIDSIKLGMGARSCITDKEGFISLLRESIANILNRNALTESDISAVIASGMITSEFGLCNLPHIVAPVGIGDLHDNMKKLNIPEICDIPFYFIPGVKTISTDETEIDMMRGEETEFFGLSNVIGENGVCILPGSHSKIIFSNGENKIDIFKTMLSGEMIFSLSQHTILCDAVDLSIPSVDEDYLIRGYKSAQKIGINAALFKVRILKNLLSCTPQQVYSYFCGVVLFDEIKAVISTGAKKAFIGGKKQIREATATLLRTFSECEVTVGDDFTIENCVSYGAVRIFEAK